MNTKTKLIESAETMINAERDTYDYINNTNIKTELIAKELGLTYQKYLYKRKMKTFTFQEICMINFIINKHSNT